jgi:hypothetical protein
MKVARKHTQNSCFAPLINSKERYRLQAIGCQAGHDGPHENLAGGLSSTLSIAVSISSLSLLTNWYGHPVVPLPSVLLPFIAVRGWPRKFV